MSKTYEIEVNGKVYEVEADKDLTDADVLSYAKQFGGGGGGDKPQVVDLLKTTPPKPRKPSFADRVAKEWDFVREGGLAGDFENSKQMHRDVLQGHLAGNGPIDRALALGDSALAVGTQVPMAIAGGLGGLGRTALGLLKGEDDPLAAGGETARQVMAAAYHPKTPLGKATVQMLMSPVTVASDLAGAVGGSLGRIRGQEDIGSSIGQAVPQLALGVQAGRSLWDARPQPVPSGAAATVPRELARQPALLRAPPKQEPLMANPPEPSMSGLGMLGALATGGKLGRAKVAAKLIAKLLLSDEPKPVMSKFSMSRANTEPVFASPRDDDGRAD